MKKTIFALFASAAAMASTAAFAADAAAVVDATPSPTSYVKVCDAFGNGYFYIPGTETCLKVGGNVSFSGGYDSFQKKGFAAADATVSLTTKSDSELGTIGTVVSVGSYANAENFLIGLPQTRTNDIQEAYISVGPGYVGYHKTMFNTDLTYGDDVMNLANRMSSSASVGYLQDGIAGNFYAGGAVEMASRGNFVNNNGIINSGNTPDLVGRVGYRDASIGTFDVSGIWSKTNNTWFVKGTADIAAINALSFRVTAGYGNVVGYKDYMVGASAKYAFSDQIAAFAGVGFDKAIKFGQYTTADVGVTWTPVQNFDVTGQVSYFDGSLPYGGSVKGHGYNTKITLSRSF